MRRLADAAARRAERREQREDGHGEGLIQQMEKCLALHLGAEAHPGEAPAVRVADEMGLHVQVRQERVLL